MTYEDLDRRLVNALLDDGRASLRGLGETLDVSVTTVSNHLSTLEADGIIDGYTPKINYRSLGFDVTAVIHLKVDGSSLIDVSESLSEHDEMISIYEVTGQYDIIAIGKFRNTDAMNDKIKDLLADPEIIESNTSVVLDAPSEHAQFELELTE